MRLRTSVLVVLAFTAGAFLFWRYRIIEPATVLVVAPSTSANTGNGDAYVQVYPMAAAAARAIRSGAIPLWNPFQQAGHPFLATGLYGVLYPFNFPYLILPTAVAIEAVVLIHLIAAGVFMFVFARRFVGSLGAVTAGIAFMCSGFIAAEAAWFPPAVASAAWLPLGFAAIEGILQTRRAIWIVPLALAVAMPLFAGWIQTWVYSVYAVAAYATVRVGAEFLNHTPDTWRRASLLAAGFALGIALTAVQALPAFELAGLGPRRPGGLTIAQVLILGVTAPTRLFAEIADASPAHPRFAYAGALLFLLAPLALASRDRLRPMFFWSLAVLALLIALTVFTPVLAAFRMLPAAGLFRKPQRILLLHAFAAAVLSGVGVDVLARTTAASRKARLVALGAGTASAMAVLLAPVPPRTRVILVVGAVLAWMATLARTAATRRLVVGGLVALLAADLALATRVVSLHPYQGVGVLDEAAELFDWVAARQGLERTYIHEPSTLHYALMAKHGTLRSIYTVTDYEPLSLSRTEQFFGPLQRRHRDPPALLTFTGGLDFDPASPHAPLFELLSTRFILSNALALPFRAALARHAPGWQQVRTSADGKFVLYENSAVLPRAYVAHRATTVADGEAALAALMQPQFDRWRTVVIEAGSGDALASDDRITPARITSYEPSTVRIETDTAAAGYLVLTDTFYPGWTARVNGVPAPIRPANARFRAVRVAAGRHTVEFRYQPASFAIGATVSLAALLSLGVVAWVGRKSH